MTDIQPEPIAELIERSSLGTPAARYRRSTVPVSTGRAIARSVVAGRFVSTAAAARHPPDDGQRGPQGQASGEPEEPKG